MAEFAENSESNSNFFASEDAMTGIFGQNAGEMGASGKKLSANGTTDFFVV